MFLNGQYEGPVTGLRPFLVEKNHFPPIIFFQNQSWIYSYENHFMYLL